MKAEIPNTQYDKFNSKYAASAIMGGLSLIFIFITIYIPISDKKVERSGKVINTFHREHHHKSKTTTSYHLILNVDSIGDKTLKVTPNTFDRSKIGDTKCFEVRMGDFEENEDVVPSWMGLFFFLAVVSSFGSFYFYQKHE